MEHVANIHEFEAGFRFTHGSRSQSPRLQRRVQIPIDRVLHLGEVTFRVRYNFWQNLPTELVLQVICNTAFGNNLDIVSSVINNHLISAIVERSRLESDTFHLCNGECTITLEDVAYQLELPIDGDAITGATSMDMDLVCLNLLGSNELA
ncbi:hypothetical protein Lal_00014094 [Lupinus albus]|nr:hypothetical protein Lal_00014094 [Lupinus albus]